jgi:hypothetical protein
MFTGTPHRAFQIFPINQEKGVFQKSLSEYFIKTLKFNFLAF